MDIAIRVLLFLALVCGIAQAVTTTTGNGFGAVGLLILVAAFSLMGVRYAHENRPPRDDSRSGYTEREADHEDQK